MEYYLTRWTWGPEIEGTDFGENIWHVPGARGTFDFRTLPEQGSRDGGNPGLALCWFPNTIRDLNAVHLGSDLQQITALQRQGLESELGIRDQLPGTSLLSAVIGAITLHADPTGQDAWKPLLPTKNLQLEFRMSGHGGRPVFRRRFTSLTDNEWPNIRDTLRADYRRIRQESLDGKLFPDQYRRYLAILGKKFRTDYKEFIPSDLVDEGTMRPGTIQSESFNQADSSTLGPDLSWTETRGSWDTVSNEVRHTSTGSGTARADADVSSDDNFGEIEFTNNGGSTTNYIAACTRFSSSADTFYVGINRGVANQHLIAKEVTGSFTTISSVSGSVSPPVVTLIDVDGSNLELFEDAVSRDTGTDTAITGNLRGGLRSRGLTANARGNNYVIDDGVAAPSTAVSDALGMGIIPFPR